MVPDCEYCDYPAVVTVGVYDVDDDEIWFCVRCAFAFIEGMKKQRQHTIMRGRMDDKDD